jgi:hypothetical protein
MATKHLSQYPQEASQMQHALRMGATLQEYRDCVKALAKPVLFECPLGEAIGSLAGFAWVWRMKGLLQAKPIVESDRFNAQGLEGKVSIPCSLYDALFYSMQASSEFRAQIRES